MELWLRLYYIKVSLYRKARHYGSDAGTCLVSDHDRGVVNMLYRITSGSCSLFYYTISKVIYLFLKRLSPSQQ